MSARAFEIFCLVMVAGMIFGWGARDIFLLFKNWSKRRERHDQFFGSIIGLVLCALGLFGLIKHYWLS